MSLNDMVLPGLHESETAVVKLVSITTCMACIALNCNSSNLILYIHECTWRT